MKYISPPIREYKCNIEHDTLFHKIIPRIQPLHQVIKSKISAKNPIHLHIMYRLENANNIIHKELKGGEGNINQQRRCFPRLRSLATIQNALAFSVTMLLFLTLFLNSRLSDCCYVNRLVVYPPGQPAQ
jgi:hypothetical protein